MVKKIIDQHQWKSATTPVSDIHSHNDPQIEKFIATLTYLQTKKWNKEEKAVFESIQQLRNTYAESKKTIEILDYGAGNPDAQLTEEDMMKGIASTALVSNIYKQAATSVKFGELIFKLIRNFQPKHCLELGTSLGISAAYQMGALKLNHNGKFVTIEGSPEIAKIAEKNLQQLTYSNFDIRVGKFIDVLPDILTTEDPIDFLFIDGHHDMKATIEYYEYIYPFLSKRAIVIFDDINWSVGMKQAWYEIYLKGQGIKVAFDLYHWGICLIDKDETDFERTCYQVTF